MKRARLDVDSLSDDELREVISDALRRYGGDCMPLREFVDFLRREYGLSREEASRLWFRAVKRKVASVGIALVEGVGLCTVIRLAEEEPVDVIY